MISSAKCLPAKAQTHILKYHPQKGRSCVVLLVSNAFFKWVNTWDILYSDWAIIRISSIISQGSGGSAGYYLIRAGTSCSNMTFLYVSYFLLTASQSQWGCSRCHVHGRRQLSPWAVHIHHRYPPQALLNLLSGSGTHAVALKLH